MIRIAPSPDDEAGLAVVLAGLRRANALAHEALSDPNRAPVPLRLLAREEGEVVGGLNADASPHSGWTHVHHLWVAETHRGRGLGAELMRRAEDESRRLGCRHIRLETMEFQAPGFYRALGYTEFGRLEESIPALGSSPAATEIFLRKDLA